MHHTKDCEMSFKVAITWALCATQRIQPVATDVSDETLITDLARQIDIGSIDALFDKQIQPLVNIIILWTLISRRRASLDLLIALHRMCGGKQRIDVQLLKMITNTTNMYEQVHPTDKTHSQLTLHDLIETYPTRDAHTESIIWFYALYKLIPSTHMEYNFVHQKLMGEAVKKATKEPRILIGDDEPRTSRWEPTQQATKRKRVAKSVSPIPWTTPCVNTTSSLLSEYTIEKCNKLKGFNPSNLPFKHFLDGMALAIQIINILSTQIPDEATRLAHMASEMSECNTDTASSCNAFLNVASNIPSVATAYDSIIHTQNKQKALLYHFQTATTLATPVTLANHVKEYKVTKEGIYIAVTLSSLWSNIAV
jgi:hypothetical protein